MATTKVYVVTVLCHTHCTAHSYYFDNNTDWQQCANKLLQAAARMRKKGRILTDTYHEINVRPTMHTVNTDCAVALTLDTREEEIPYLP